MYNSVILPLAKEDIRDAARWYNKQSQGLGKGFTSEVRDSIQFIKHNPTACNIRYDQVRTVVLKVFPFMIHYTVDEDNKTVIVSAVLHTSRDPEVWKKR
jgi:plasmid stabilization system protein ParE